MKEVIAIVSRKGGSGKTTTAQAIGAGLKTQGKKVLLIDLDAQCNLSTAMGADLKQPAVTELFEGTPASDLIQRTENGDVIVGSSYLDAADLVLENNAELKIALSNIRRMYDYIIIDTPASPGRLTLNALNAATSAIITVESAPFSFDGMNALVDTIKKVQQVNKRLKIRGVIICKYEGRSNVDKQLLVDFVYKASEMGTTVLMPPIRATSKVRDAQLARKNLNKYAPRSTAAKDYRSIVDQILNW